MASGLLKTSPSWAMLPIRIALGTIMFAHGAQKVFGVWGGAGLSQWIERVPPFPDMRPPWLWMGALALSQFFGGAMVMIGLYTRIGAFLTAAVATVAIFGEHWNNGFFISSGGFEYSFALLGMALALLIYGGGAASIDSQMQVGK
jgi:putative oxidoreductase